MVDDDGFELHLEEPGFQGTLAIVDRDGVRTVVASGIRPDGTGSNVGKEVPADRDARLTELVEACLRGDASAGPAILAHIGLLDPA